MFSDSTKKELIQKERRFMEKIKFLIGPKDGQKLILKDKHYEYKSFDKVMTEKVHKVANRTDLIDES